MSQEVATEPVYFPVLGHLGDKVTNHTLSLTLTLT